jgi:hypothetical protein
MGTVEYQAATKSTASSIRNSKAAGDHRRVFMLWQYVPGADHELLVVLWLLTVATGAGVSALHVSNSCLCYCHNAPSAKVRRVKAHEKRKTPTTSLCHGRRRTG